MTVSALDPADGRSMMVAVASVPARRHTNFTTAAAEADPIG
jgi:hypothetical protein